MNLARSVAEILSDHVTLEVEGIDRMYLNAVVPVLQSEGGITWFFRECRGQVFASSALGSGEDGGFPHRTSAQPPDGSFLRLAGALDGHGQPVLLLRCRS